MDMEHKEFTLSISEMPKGIFTAQIIQVRGAIAQETSKEKAISQAFLMAYRSLEIDSANLID